MAGVLRTPNPDISCLSYNIVPYVVRHVAWKKRGVRLKPSSMYQNGGACNV
jgi:hypothetical protein